MYVKIVFWKNKFAYLNKWMQKSQNLLRVECLNPNPPTAYISY